MRARGGCSSCAGWPLRGTPRAPTSGCTPPRSGAQPPSTEVVAEPVGQLDLVEGVVQQLVLVLVGPRLGQLQLVEDPELHGNVLPNRTNPRVGPATAQRTEGDRVRPNHRRLPRGQRPSLPACPTRRSTAPARCGSTSSTTTPSSPARAARRRQRRRRHRRRWLHRACGRRTTWPWPIRRCASRSSRPRSPGTAHRGATAAGVPRSFPSPSPRWHVGTAGHRPCRLHQAMRSTVDEVGRVAGAERHRLPLRQGRHGGARPQPGPVATGQGRGRRGARLRHRRGRPRPAGAATRRRRRRAADGRARCDLFTPHCAAIHPARLVRGWPGAVERRGVHGLRADRGHRDRARAWSDTEHGRVRADRWSSGRPRATPRSSPAAPHGGPVYSLMVATEPLADVVLGRARPRAARDLHRRTAT